MPVNEHVAHAEHASISLSATTLRVVNCVPAGHVTSPADSMHDAKPDGAAPSHTAPASDGGTSQVRTACAVTCRDRAGAGARPTGQRDGRGREGLREHPALRQRRADAAIDGDGRARHRAPGPVSVGGGDGAHRAVRAGGDLAAAGARARRGGRPRELVVRGAVARGARGRGGLVRDDALQPAGIVARHAVAAPSTGAGASLEASVMLLPSSVVVGASGPAPASPVTEPSACSRAPGPASPEPSPSVARPHPAARAPARKAQANERMTHDDPPPPSPCNRAPGNTMR